MGGPLELRKTISPWVIFDGIKRRFLRLCQQQDSTPKCNAVGIKIVWHFSLSREHSWAYLCLMSFYLIGTAFPGFLSPLVLYAFDLFVLFLHLTFEQNSVICPPQGSLQRFFRGGGLSPPAIDSLLATILCIQCSIQGWAEKMGPRLREFFRQGEAKVVSNSRNKLQQT